jgi:signal transduction histidine kinase
MAVVDLVPGIMLDEQRLRRILKIGTAVVSELDLETVLEAVVEEARSLTGARYAALGVLDPEDRELERFITAGASPQMREAIGDLPRGRGVLGVLITDPTPLRLDDVSRHPRSFGFPVGHPPMRSFLGVPVVIRGRPWGNLYLTDKQGADAFGPDDEEAIVLLAGWAAIAIDNARAYQREQDRRVELEQAVQGLEATTAIARALGGETDVDRILELIVKRARALIDARGVLMVLRDGDDLVVRAMAGALPGAITGMRLPLEGSFGGDVLRTGRPERTSDIRGRLRFGLAGHVEARAALFVPLIFHGRALGVLEVFDRHDDADFSDADERLLLGFAASAATAVATAQSAASEALRRSLQSSERERQRWARELHDETLQQLAGLKLLLASARRDGRLERAHDAMGSAIAQLDTSIADLRRLITDLRPAALDDLGLQAALESLVDRCAQTAGLQITLDVQLSADRPHSEVEDAAYRIVQEALTNVMKHAGATRVDIAVGETDRAITLAIADDGRGFDADRQSDGFGLIGMRERVALLGGRLEVTAPDRGGTIVRAQLPSGAPDRRALTA